MASESTIDQHLVKRVKQLGGISLKTDRLQGQVFVDRTIFLPGGRTVIIETKRPKGGRREAHQIEIIERLQAMGHEAFFCKTKEEVDEALQWVDAG